MTVSMRMQRVFWLSVGLFLLMELVCQPVLTAQTLHRTLDAMMRRRGSRTNRYDNMKPRNHWPSQNISNMNDVASLYDPIKACINISRNDTGSANLTADCLMYMLFSAIPGEGDNEAGVAAMTAMANKLKQYIPGSCYYGFTNHAHFKCDRHYEAYQSVFVPKYNNVIYQLEVEHLTGLPEEWWTLFSVIILCRAMYDLTSELRPLLDGGSIMHYEDYYTEFMLRWSMDYYAYVFTYDTEQFRETWRRIDYHEHEKYKDMYIHQGLLSGAWIMAKRVEASEGNWRNPGPAWEMFHHFLKLRILGASNQEIDWVVQELVRQELLMPPEIATPGIWRNYTGWFEPDFILNSMKDDAHGGIMAPSACNPFFNKCCWTGSEHQSFRFTKSGHPGHWCRK